MAANSTSGIFAAAVNVFGNEHSHEHGVCMLPSRAGPGHPASLLKERKKKGERGAVITASREKREHCQHGHGDVFSRVTGALVIAK